MKYAIGNISGSKMKTYAALTLPIIFASMFLLAVLATAGEIPRLIEKGGRYELLVDGKPFFMLGAQMNNSSDWPSVLPEVWQAVTEMRANTLEAPVYWQQVERVQGKFNFSDLDTLLEQARLHGVRVVILWFGAWKNGSMNYAPDWVKLDTARYPRLLDADRRPTTVLSEFFRSTLDADRAAFAALMRHLKSVDEVRRTVIMVQVENETGTWGITRDFSGPAEKEFHSSVPDKLLRTLNKQPGTWEQVFGSDADEMFSAYYIARYVDQVAEAGKEIYPLPMYANAALRDPEDPAAQPGRSYASGGPTFNVLDVWKEAAPHIDILCPDIYLRNRNSYLKTLMLYSRRDNPLFVPETANLPENARYLFSVIDLGGIGFSPFGIDYTGYVNAPLGWDQVSPRALRPFSEEYELLAPMVQEVAHLNFEGKVKTAVEGGAAHYQILDFGRWRATVSYGLPQFGFGDNPPGNPDSDGCALISQLGPDEFLVTGIDARVSFMPSPDSSNVRSEYLRVEEGSYDNGVWRFTRLWNGDQTDWGLNFKHRLQVLHVVLHTF